MKKKQPKQLSPEEIRKIPPALRSEEDYKILCDAVRIETMQIKGDLFEAKFDSLDLRRFSVELIYILDLPIKTTALLFDVVSGRKHRWSKKRIVINDESRNSLFKLNYN